MLFFGRIVSHLKFIPSAELSVILQTIDQLKGELSDHLDLKMASKSEKKWISS